MRRIGEVGGALRRFWDEQVALAERRSLAMAPWEEDLLHWARTPAGGWELHGSRIPPPGRRRSTTRDGWCPALPR